MTALPPASGRATGTPADRVLPALAEASRRTGVSFDALFRTARLESGFDPGARARTSSATGLFQFVDRTWLQTLARHGPQHGLTAASRDEALALRTDPYAASLMAAHHMADNAALLSARIGRAPDQVDLYLAHFLGASGAAEFIGALADAPDQPAAPLMPAAARANRNIFFAEGRPRTLSEVYDMFARKLGAAGPPAGASPMLHATDAAETIRNGSPGTLVPGRSEPAAGSVADAAGAAHSARLAYLLLADLGA